MPYPEITQITPLPPRGSDPAVFTAGWNTFFSEQPQFIADVNEAGEYIESSAAAAEQSAQEASQTLTTLNNQIADAVTEATGEAQGYANAASNSAGEANGYVQDAANLAGIALSAANFVGNWSDISGTLAVPASVYHEGAFWALLNDISDVQAEEPGVSDAWQALQGTVRVKTTPIGAPDWPCTLTYDTEGNLTIALYSQNNARFRQTLSYTAGDLSSVLYEQSADSGATWSVIGTETLVYTDGNLTSTTWTEGA